MYYLSIFIMIFFILGCAKTPEPLSHHVDCKSDIYAMTQAKCISQKRLVSALSAYDVIFMGDYHDAPHLHQAYATIIREMSKRGYRIHLANEWFTPKDNALLYQYAHKMIDDNNFSTQIDFNATVGYPFESFVPLYHAVQENGGALYGINLEKEERQKISDDNTSAMRADALAFYYSIDTNVSTHQQLLAPFLQHCHAPKKGESHEACLKRIYKVQVAWDEKMGLEVAKLSKKILTTPQDKLLVFAGAMHVEYGLGIPMRFARHSDKSFTTLVPRERSQKRLDHGVADFVMFYK
ncbi:MAG TPA: hypothetical protein ENK68_00030 [Epsilonproteobacteria bacterium]|nr:hypothetical protein [Campylobacterota bacterium]